MSTRAYLENPKGQIEFQFGGNIYHLPSGKTYLDDWDGVPERLAPDVANQVMDGYAFYRPVQGEAEVAWVTRGNEEESND